MFIRILVWYHKCLSWLVQSRSDLSMYVLYLAGQRTLSGWGAPPLIPAHFAVEAPSFALGRTPGALGSVEGLSAVSCVTDAISRAARPARIRMLRAIRTETKRVRPSDPTALTYYTRSGRVGVLVGRTRRACLAAISSGRARFGISAPPARVAWGCRVAICVHGAGSTEAAGHN
jgi:hypothetical protein